LLAFRYTERSGYLNRIVMQSLADLVCHDLAKPVEVAPEEDWIQLESLVPHLEEIVAGNRRPGR
jgi:hypothetical protein